MDKQQQQQGEHEIVKNEKEEEEAKDVVDNVGKQIVENDDHASTISKDGAAISCLGRMTWRGAGETDIDETGSDDESEEDDEHDNDDASDTSSSTETIVRKQSKWGWMVVFGSMVIHMIADGITFSFGVLLYSLIDTFHVTKSDVALVGSILGGLPLFFGPVCSYLVNRFSCRAVTITGGIITAFGFFLSSFVQNFNWFYLTMSFISGVGLSLVYVPAVVIVAYYFEEQRSLATGLAVSGTGIGYALFAPLIDVMLERLKWRNTLRVLAGCFLVISFCGALFRPIEYQVEKKAKHKKEKKVEISEESARLKEKKRRRKRKRTVTYEDEDSRLPSRMSSTEKLERFIRRMEEAEIDRDDEDMLDEYLGITIDRKTQENTENNKKVEVDEEREIKIEGKYKKTLVKSFSIAALPSFYLNYDNEQNEKSAKVQLQLPTAMTSAQSSELDNKNIASEHDQLKLVLKKQLGGAAAAAAAAAVSNTQQQQQPNKFQKAHTEAANLCSIPEHKPLVAIQPAVLSKSQSSSKSSIQTQYDQESLKHLSIDDNKSAEVIPMVKILKTAKQPKGNKQANKKTPNMASMAVQVKKKQDLLRAYNLPLCRKDIFYRGSVINLRRMLLKQLPEKLNYNKNNMSNINILYSMNMNPSMYGQNASITFSCPNLYLRYPYDHDGSSSSSSSSTSTSDSSLTSTLSSSSISSLLDDDDTGGFRRRRRCCSIKHSKNKCLKRTCNVFKHFFSISIIKNPLFLLFGISNFIFYMWHEIPMMFIRDYTDECKCMKNYEIWIIFISCGIANAIGQWIYGYLGDREKINEKILYAVSTIICGVTVLTIPFALKSLGLMITNQILFGVFLSANYVLNSIILVEILGVDKLTDAYGMLLLLQGFALVIGSPLAGWIGDITKDYNNTFYFAGAFIILSGVMLLFLPLVEKLYRKHKIKKKRLKLQKQKRKVLTSKILNHPLYSPNGNNNSEAVVPQKHNVIMSTITEDEDNEQKALEETANGAITVINS